MRPSVALLACADVMLLMLCRLATFIIIIILLVMSQFAKTTRHVGDSLVFGRIKICGNL